LCIVLLLGMLWVEWDNGHRNCYNYKGHIMEVVEVDNPRVLGNNDLIAAGCLVKKGVYIFYHH